jgi:hypothetical protein
MDAPAEGSCQLSDFTALALAGAFVIASKVLAPEFQSRGRCIPRRRYSKGRGSRKHHRRRATAIPSRNATNSEPRGASRAMLLKMLNGMPGFRPASIAPLTRWTVPFTASAAIEDFASGTGIRAFVGGRGQRDVITHDLISKPQIANQSSGNCSDMAILTAIASAAAGGAAGASSIAPKQSQSRPRSTSNRADCPAPSSQSLASRHGKYRRCSHKRLWRS